MRRKYKNQWLLLLCVIITLTISGSFLFSRNNINVKVLYVKTTAQTTAASFSLAPLRHVTKSLAELGKMDEINSHILFLNQIPKCGSEVLIILLQKLQGINNYRHVRLKGKNKGRLSRLKQEELVYEVYDVIRNEAVPLSFDRHMYFINFTSFDKQLPTYINLIRDPVDKFYSGSSFKKANAGHIKCLLQKEGECKFKNTKEYDFMIPYFCGHDARCTTPNDEWAFNQAKYNVEKYYPVVGVLEELNATLEVLEHKIPYFFKDVQKLYASDLLYIHSTNPKKKLHIPDFIRNKFKNKLVKEYEFYEWIKGRLFGQLQILYGEHNSH